MLHSILHPAFLVSEHTCFLLFSSCWFQICEFYVSRQFQSSGAPSNGTATASVSEHFYKFQEFLWFFSNLFFLAYFKAKSTFNSFNKKNDFFNAYFFRQIKFKFPLNFKAHFFKNRMPALLSLYALSSVKMLGWTEACSNGTFSLKANYVVRMREII